MPVTVNTNNAVTQSVLRLPTYPAEEVLHTFCRVILVAGHPFDKKADGETPATLHQKLHLQQASLTDLLLHLVAVLGNATLMRRLIILAAILLADSPVRSTDDTSTDTTTAPAIIGNTSTVIYSMPTTCEKDGKTYREGETWNRGHLRYKCAKYGVYSIEGCRTDKDRELQIGESFVDENVVHQCYTRDGAVYYRQAVCGIYGQPACEDMKDPTKFMMPTAPTQVRTVNIPQNPASGLPQLAGLPEGWRIVDKNGNPVPISDIRITTHTVYLPAGPQGKRRRRRQTGVGSFVPVSVDDPRDHRKHMPGSTGSNSTSMAKGNVAGVGTGSVDLHHRSKTVSVNTTGLKPNSLAGTRSDTSWKGKTIHTNGREVATGPGTFTFGTSPTGAFVHRVGGAHGSQRTRRQTGVGSFVPISVDDPRDNRQHMPGVGTSASAPMSGGRVAGMGTGSADLHHRSETISVNTTGLKPDSIGGSRSDTSWKGKTIRINGKEVAVGPGTFTFGTSPTGSFVHRVGGGNKTHGLQRGRRQTGVGSFVPVSVDDPRDNRKHMPGSSGNVAGVGTGSVDLHHRSKTISANTTGLKPDSIAGNRSDTSWKGKTIRINGKEVAVGPGTFTVGTSPTGAFVRPVAKGRK
ncbi:hypothetical protein QR680_001022 [Steinernema hermaphroditum]|uniref:Abnormal cell migration protein 18-like fibronectin type I domain-containing protein n=1 Tax=Steinernema hermaphroditum TaxID=289476 RepID=A0AA39GWP7_9BILA|nr:hypothetical protein QR680_001022 [Steinernema hermaphroditum]